MRHRTVAIVFAAAACLINRSTRADAPPTIAELKQMVVDGKYSAALAGSSRLIGLTGPAARGLDKAGAYAVRAEVHLHLKAFTPAADDFAGAAKSATDPRGVAGYKADELLVRRSKTGLYTPKQPGADEKPLPAFDVSDETTRDAAIGALFADDYAADAPKLRAAKSATTVPELLTAAGTALRLRTLEVAATGKDEKVGPELTAISEHAHDLIDTTLQTDDKRLDDISRVANQTIVGGTGGGRGGYGGIVTQRRKTGLSGRNAAEIQQIIATCQKVGPVAQAFASATVDDGGTASTWDSLTADAKRVGAKANDIATADYSGGGRTNPQPRR